jgi:hypothetical protein
MRFRGRTVGIIFDGNEAEITAYPLSYKRTRGIDETMDDFERRIKAEVASLAPKSSQ